MAPPTRDLAHGSAGDRRGAEQPAPGKCHRSTVAAPTAQADRAGRAVRRGIGSPVHRTARRPLCRSRRGESPTGPLGRTTEAARIRPGGTSPRARRARGPGDNRRVGAGRAHDPTGAAGAEEVGEHAVREAADKAVSGGGDAPSRAVELLGRFGLVAYGVVHLLVAGLGVRLALGARGAQVDQRGAIAAVASVGPLGTAVLVVFVAGLAAFAVWQVSAAVAGFRWVCGAERRRKRIGALAKAVAVVAVAVIAARFVADMPGGSGRTGPEWLRWRGRSWATSSTTCPRACTGWRR